MQQDQHESSLEHTEPLSNIKSRINMADQLLDEHQRETNSTYDPTDDGLEGLDYERLVEENPELAAELIETLQKNYSLEEALQ